jgi:small subunit ribosomal protein S4
MARFRGSKSKVSRRYGENLFGGAKSLAESLKRKNYPPGQHGRGRRKKNSDYAVQLMEKQKAKYIYGVLERQFRKTFERASKMQGMTGVNLLRLLESRLDNTIYRLGIAPTRRAARQLVSHKHITVNGEVVNIPSYTLRAGDVVAVREKSKSLQAILESVSSNRKRHAWLEWDSKELQGIFLAMPDRENIDENIKEQLIVELYSK